MGGLRRDLGSTSAILKTRQGGKLGGGEDLLKKKWVAWRFRRVNDRQRPHRNPEPEKKCRIIRDLRLWKEKSRGTETQGCPARRKKGKGKKLFYIQVQGNVRSHPHQSVSLAPRSLFSKTSFARGKKKNKRRRGGMRGGRNSPGFVKKAENGNKGVRTDPKGEPRGKVSEQIPAEGPYHEKRGEGNSLNHQKRKEERCKSVTVKTRGKTIRKKCEYQTEIVP